MQGAGANRELSALAPLLAAVTAGACVAVGIVWQPVPTVALLGAALLAVLSGVGSASRLPDLFLIALGGLLAGYAFLGKGFAYLGHEPLRVGEAVLGLGLLAAAFGGGLGAVLRSRLAWVLGIFMLLGAARTVPYWSVHGMDSLRDAVLWGYGAFALCAVACFAQSGRFRDALAAYGRVLPWLLLWIPLAMLIYQLIPDKLPRVPGSGGVPLLHVKGGDMAVHLAGATGFFMLGLHRRSNGREGSDAREWLWWMAVLVGFVLSGAQNRGGMISFLSALGVLSLGGGLGRLAKPILIGVALTSLFLLVGTEVDLGRGRKASPQQLARNVQSILGGDSHSELGGTKEWRLNWWTDIVNYTFFGEHFFTGKGFGVNLADDDGYQVDYDKSLRSPHNGHFTVLARMGVPGLALWVLLQGSFGWALFRAHRRARRTGREWWARVDLWILAYWSAFLVNASFDVFLEGPQAGIWFWSLMGCGITALQLQRSELDDETAAATIRRPGRCEA